MNITQIGIIHTELVCNQDQTNEAARFVLDWNGDSEGDSPLEFYYADADVDDIKFYVFPRWGHRASRSSDFDPIEVFTDEYTAAAWVNEANDKALADMEEVEWIELPKPVDFIYFGGCSEGQYPQSRIAKITAVSNGTELTGIGYGHVTYIRDRHSAEALNNAIKDLIAKLDEL